MTKQLNVGIIGYGFMGRTHSNAYRRLTNFFDVPYKPVLKTICGLEEKEAKAFADKWGFESYVTDWRKVMDDKSIDVVDICVPNNYHAELAIAAAQAGKMIICEKPLARGARPSEVKAVEKAGCRNVCSLCDPP
jgi:predicted dehydrogenase